MAAANYTDHVAAIAERIGEARDQATVHALLVEGVHALGAIRQVGLMIADRQAGPFALEVRRIGLA